MKCNIHKVNDFFKNNQDEDIKKFILKLLEEFSKNDYNDTYVAFSQLDFFEIDDNDDIEDVDDLFVIDFITISNLEEKLKKFIIKMIIEDNDASDTIINSVLIPYKDWERVNRKNKLLNIQQNY